MKDICMALFPGFAMNLAYLDYYYKNLLHISVLKVYIRSL